MSRGFRANSLSVLVAICSLVMGCAQQPTNADVAAKESTKAVVVQGQGWRDITTGERRFEFCSVTSGVVDQDCAIDPSPKTRAPQIVFGAAGPASTTSLGTKRVEDLLYQVPFEYDRSDLGPEGSKVVSDVIAAASRSGVRQVLIRGSADSISPKRDQYNLALATRRVEAVKRALDAAKVTAPITTASAILKIWPDGTYPATEEFMGRRADVTIKIELSSRGK
jgi:outer membrane protein OmpA-like peptidoglycan-associated protein